MALLGMSRAHLSVATAVAIVITTSTASKANEEPTKIAVRDWENYKEPGLRPPVVDPISVGVGGVFGAINGAFAVTTGTTILTFIGSVVKGGALGSTKSILSGLGKGSIKEILLPQTPSAETSFPPSKGSGPQRAAERISAAYDLRPVGAENKKNYNRDKYFAGDKPDRFIAIMARDTNIRGRDIGHAYIMWIGPDESNRQSIREVWGFAPPKNDSTVVRVINAFGSDGQVFDEFDIEAIENADISVQMIVNEEQWGKSREVLRDWQKGRRYEVLFSDCVEFAGDILSAIGVNPPIRAMYPLPIDYVREVKDSVEKAQKEQEQRYVKLLRFVFSNIAFMQRSQVSYETPDYSELLESFDKVFGDFASNVAVSTPPTAVGSGNTSSTSPSSAGDGLPSFSDAYQAEQIRVEQSRQAAENIKESVRKEFGPKKAPGGGGTPSTQGGSSSSTSEGGMSPP